jgi:hypothetical protein
VFPDDPFKKGGPLLRTTFESFEMGEAPLSWYGDGVDLIKRLVVLSSRRRQHGDGTGNECWASHDSREVNNADASC